MKREARRWFHSVLSYLPGEFGNKMRCRCFGFHEIGTGVNIQERCMFYHAGKISIGEGCNISMEVVMNGGGGIEIGRNVLIGPSTKIWSINHVYKELRVPIVEQGWEYKKVTIMDDVWLGANVIVLPGVTIGKGAVIPAGSIVSRDVQPYWVVMGYAAREFCMRGN